MSGKPKFSIKTGEDHALERQLAWDRLKHYGIVEGEEYGQVKMTDRFNKFVRENVARSELLFPITDWASEVKYPYTGFQVAGYAIAHFVPNFFSKHDIEELGDMAYLLTGVLDVEEERKKKR